MDGRRNGGLELALDSAIVLVVVLGVGAAEAKRQPSTVPPPVLAALLDGEVAEHPPPGPRHEHHLLAALEHEPAVPVAADLPARPGLGPLLVPHYHPGHHVPGAAPLACHRRAGPVQVEVPRRRRRVEVAGVALVPPLAGAEAVRPLVAVAVEVHLGAHPVLDVAVEHGQVGRRVVDAGARPLPAVGVLLEAALEHVVVGFRSRLQGHLILGVRRERQRRQWRRRR
ncbi:hypothetical protein PVAP13_6NG182203 [Panicum virgatum]|uniref:Secreted protein n=1 Tax=Panicum virgatum TaxID=38727 RepID=A0A8T0QYD0_PANVG|nr:hypothetical protein PVAP13_6NG182203 [Panicum virgatum]